MPKFCYWSVADGDHAKMMIACIASARACGVEEDFHIWSDQDIPGAIVHKVGKFNKDNYLFKFRFLRNEVSKLEGYDYVVWLDADNFFLRHPGDYANLLRDNRWFVQLESEITSPLVRRGDWWGCPTPFFPLLVRYYLLMNGFKADKVYNTNAGFWIVRTEAIVEFYELAMAFFDYSRNTLKLVNFTEEAPLAYIGHMVDDPEQNTLRENHDIWACDWTGQYRDRLPDGNPWEFEDYMSGEKKRVNPCICHCMRSKNALIKASYPPIKVVIPDSVKDEG